MQRMNYRTATVALLSTLLLSACAVTEDSLRASSETIKNTSEATSDFTSSTSHKDDEHHTRNREAREFAVHNLDNLRINIARGSGPHLAALAELLNVSQVRRPAFYATAKQHFADLFPNTEQDADSMLLTLNKYL